MLTFILIARTVHFYLGRKPYTVLLNINCSMGSNKLKQSWWREAREDKHSLPQGDAMLWGKCSICIYHPIVIECQVFRQALELQWLQGWRTMWYKNDIVPCSCQLIYMSWDQRFSCIYQLFILCLETHSGWFDWQEEHLMIRVKLLDSPGGLFFSKVATEFRTLCFFLSERQITDTQQ